MYLEHLKKYVVVCGGAMCSKKSAELAERFEAELQKLGLQKQVGVFISDCMDNCDSGPNVTVQPGNTVYAGVTVDEAAEIATEHLLKGRPVLRLIHRDKPRGEEEHSPLGGMKFLTSQYRIALRNCGVIDPFSIDNYIAADGYLALQRAIFDMTPQEVIDEISDSGLRGRGGGGFPTGRKWAITKSYESDIKYVVCNADEGDPGAFMDRSILEGDPHSVVEGMIIAGYAVGAQRGYVYIRAEYPVAVDRLQLAVDSARKYGLLGDHILGSDLSFDIELRLGAGAFVCGEETALMNSIEGMRGEPRTKPPFPAEKGLWRKPTVENNVETFANVAPIISKGAEWFSSVGTDKSKGTKVFALGGKIVNTGLVEVPMGTTLRQIVFDIGGGIPGGAKFKAAQTGGPSGGCIPASKIDTPIDYDSLLEIGTMMGSGGMIIMDETTCMVDLARFFLEFTCDESCGKCTACRVGTKRLLEILNRITRGEGDPHDLESLEILCNTVKDASLCGLGQSAPNPVLSTLRYFRDEYEAHVHHKYCPAGVCKALAKYEIITDKCRKCSICAKNCPVECIYGVPKKEPYVIDQERCIKCGTCFEKCPFDAIRK